jgi:DNA-binding NarL/FixJ family response regulator
MARVLALVPDLLFGSRVQGSLAAAGDEVELIGDAPALRERLSAPHVPRPDVLIVDLVDAQLDGAALRESLIANELLDGIKTLAFYSHVDTDTGTRAREAGFDLVVPRSRMAREGAELVARLSRPG